MCRMKRGYIARTSGSSLDVCKNTFANMCKRRTPGVTGTNNGRYTELNLEGMLFVLTLKVHYYHILHILKKEVKRQKNQYKNQVTSLGTTRNAN